MHSIPKVSTKQIYLGGCLFLNRYCSSALVPLKELVEKRINLFQKEQKRQLEEVGRIEKISVEVAGPPEDIVLVMNKEISTPYDCCKHISKGLCQITPLAMVNGKELWDMHRPLPSDCQLKFLNFKDYDPFQLNKVFWRTGSFILGAVITKAFKENIEVHLHSFPPPMVKSGSFVYDVVMNLRNWCPTQDELKVLSAEFLTFVQQNLKIEPLKVKKSLALEILEGHPLKQKQLSNLADESKDGLITLYKVGDHVDISCGPMLANTSFFGRSAVAAVHRITNSPPILYRFQGVALPKGIMLNPHAFTIILTRAEKLNEAVVPGGYDYYKGDLNSRNSASKVPQKPFEIEVFGS